MKDEQGEKIHETEQKVIKLFQKLVEAQLSLLEVDFCRRLGKSQGDEGRPIIIGLTTERRKYEIRGIVTSCVVR